MPGSACRVRRKRAESIYGRERREIKCHVLRTYPQITQIKSLFMFLESKDNFLTICDIYVLCDESFSLILIKAPVPSRDSWVEALSY
jgi:hypothetical protein